MDTLDIPLNPPLLCLILRVFTSIYLCMYSTGQHGFVCLKNNEARSQHHALRHYKHNVHSLE